MGSADTGERTVDGGRAARLTRARLRLRHLANESTEFLERTLDGCSPWETATQADEVSIVRFRGEYDARRHADAACECRAEQLRAIDAARQLYPKHDATRRARYARAIGEVTRDSFDELLRVRCERRAHCAQVAIVAATRVVARQDELLKARAGDRRVELRACDVRVKLRAHRPADAITECDRLRHGAAGDDETCVVERAHRARTRAAVVQVPIDIVLDDRDLEFGERLHDLTLRRIGRDAAGGVIEIRHEHSRGKLRRAHDVANRFDVDTCTRNVRHFDDAQSEMLDRLQQSEVRRRFDEHGVAGGTQNLQADRDGIHRAARNHDVRRIDRRTRERHSLRDLPTQLLESGRQQTLAGVHRVISQHLTDEIVESLIGIERGRGERAVQRNDVLARQRFATRIEHLRCNRNRTARARDLRARLRQDVNARRTHVEAGLRARFDEANVLEVYIRLHDRRYADICRATHRAHGRDLVMGAKRAVRDLSLDEARDTFVQERGLRGHDVTEYERWR